ncbi:ATP-binding cassette domain-containing protein [Alkalicoccobacillus plakortidis]|uniref:ATP-binding cassette domain-containing protein n=1 Tax=Alkalicoccobacillus plakortidis TaxID=444060 RepID=A0ABT0XKF5_9BACI|nr:ATP-binding cassette domain-containing protein [Alkalicoccobacillus plakortidis]MCM2676384.1 ATP-binding cassette domain-containing protein [Alkalicoccobacillus plakortidis]
MNIAVKGLTKFIRKQYILTDVQLSFTGVYGLLGPNGAGKTTLMKVLAGLEDFQDGNVYADDDLISRSSYVKRTDVIGYMSQDFMVYPELTIYEVLEHIAHLQGEKPINIPTIINKVVEDVNLSVYTHKKMKALSGGMRRRVGIAQLLLRNPSVLLFDEPTAGLDIEERIRFRNLLKKLGQTHTVIISSHLVEDIEFLCTHIGIIREGHVLFEGTPSELKSLAKDIIYEISVKPEELDQVIYSEDVIQMDDEDTHINVRVFSENSDKGSRVKPRLMDGYLALLKEVRHE